MSRKMPLAAGETVRTASARVLLRTGVDEQTGERLTAPMLLHAHATPPRWENNLEAGTTSGSGPPS